MKRGFYLGAVVVALYALAGWHNGTKTGFDAAATERNTSDRETTGLAATPPPLPTRAAPAPKAAHEPEAPLASGPRVKSIIFPKCPKERPESDSPCDISPDSGLRCSYTIAEQEVICSCDGAESSVRRTWICRDSEEEAEIAAVPTCPEAKPTHGTACAFPTQACVYRDLSLSCKCNEDDRHWSCGPMRLPRL
jgi:hypothetical protein